VPQAEHGLPKPARDPKDCPTPERLRELFEYKDGELVCRVNRRGGARKGSVAGSRSKNGYFYLHVDSVTYTRHRLIWAMHHGWPEDRTLDIDHINRKKGDDRIENLRLLTRQGNQENTDAKGYRYDRRANKYYAQITTNGKQIYLGCFDTKEEAKAAYDAAKLKYHTHG